MEQLWNGFFLDIPPGTFPLSTDSMVLSGFVRFPRKAHILDLGAGCSTLGHLLCARDSSCTVVGLEQDMHAHQAALSNIQRNSLEQRLSSICGDIRNIPALFSPGSFQCCISNPPYYSGGPASQATPLARREDCCTMEDLFRAAAWALRFGGDFFLVHKPERLAEAISTASRFQMEAKRLCLVHHRKNGPVTLILLAFRKGGKPGLILEELNLWNENGEPTEAYRELYHL